MTALNSVKTAEKGGAFYKFLPYYLNKLRFLRPQLIMTSIFALLSYPLVGVFLTILADSQLNIEKIREQYALSEYNIAFEQQLQQANDVQYTLQSLSIMAIVIGAICLVGMFVFTFVTTLRAFRYLYDRNAVDMDYSLPVNSNTRYFADLAAVFTTSILPHLIAVLVGVIFTNVIIHKATLFQVAPDPADVEMISSIIIQAMFVGLFACIMQMAFSLLMVSLCGKKAEASLYPVLINIAIPVIHALFIGITESNTYGSSYNGITIYYPVTATSPVGMVVMTLVYIVQKFFIGTSNALDRSIGLDGTLPAFRAELMIPALLLTLAFLVGAYFLIKYRRNERVGKSYVYKGMSVIIPGIVVMAISLPMWNMVFTPFAASSAKYDYYSYTPNSGAWLMGLLISTFIIYVIMELISGKAFRKFHISVAKWAGTTAVCAGVAAVLVFSNGFGKANLVPAPEQVVRADIQLWNNAENNDSLGNISIYQTYNQDVIRNATEIHGMIPKEGPAPNESGRVQIAYLMRSGEIIERTYRVSDELYVGLMKKAVTPASWYEQYYGDQEYYLSQNDGRKIDHISYGTQNCQPGDFSLRELLDAIRKDSERINYDLYIHPEAGTKRYALYVQFAENNDDTSVSYPLSTMIPVYSWMDNAVAYLGQHGIDFGMTQFKSAFIIENHNDNNDTFSYYPNEMLAMSGGEFDQYVYDRYIDGCFAEGDVEASIMVDEKQYSFGRVDIYDPRLRGLISASESSIETRKLCRSRYVLLLSTAETYDEYMDSIKNNDGAATYYERYIVPEECYDTAAQLLEEGLVFRYGDPDWLEQYFQKDADGIYIVTNPEVVS